jgi:hypothetical protein
VIRLVTAHTRLADDADGAAVEILSQLKRSGPLSRHACGVIHCDMSFMETGVFRAVSRALPFPTLGMNTILHSSDLGAFGSTLLTVSVFTSPDVRMACALSPEMDTDVSGPSDAMYSEALADLKERPSLALVFGPILPWCASGEALCHALDAASGGVPLFGSQAGDFTPGPDSPKVLFNGEAWSFRSAILLMGANASPRFDVYPVSSRKLLKGRALITESESHVVHKVNSMPVMEFLETMGLCRNGKLVSIDVIPFFLSRSRGGPCLVRAMRGMNPDGSIVLAGNAPEGSQLDIGVLDTHHILDGARRAGAITRLASPSPSAIYSCLARNISLGLNFSMEMEAFHHETAGSSPYLFSYSMGEFCPIRLPDGGWHNEYHNMSLVRVSF